MVIEYGVPQGPVVCTWPTSLSPLHVYINDIVDCSKLDNFVLFADDTNIFVVGTTDKQAYCKAKILPSSVQQYMNLTMCKYRYLLYSTRFLRFLDVALISTFCLV